jgi:hypothetical protein
VIVAGSRRRTSVRRSSLVPRVPEDEREQEKRRADRRRKSEQLERGEFDAVVHSAEARRKRKRGERQVAGKAIRWW